QQSVALAASAAGRTAVAVPMKFEVVSIKPQPAGGALPRFACQGSDGMVEFNPFAGMAPSASAPMVVPKGRCAGQFALAEAVAVAYGMSGAANVTGGPDWARPESPARQLFYFDAKAEDASTVTKGQLLQMLKT